MNFWKHFWTITKHRHEVIRLCFQAGIPFQGLLHDLSKYRPQEFLTGVKYYQGIKSPNEKERREFGYSKAWLHHKGRNKHHFEYWLDYSPLTKSMEPVQMPRKYVAEMVCDRIAASKIYQGEKYHNGAPLIYFQQSRDRVLMHENTKNELEYLLFLLNDTSEKQTLKYIRTIYLKNKE